VNASAPLFDEIETPSNVGILTNVFRTSHARRRSLHPTHSCAAVGRHTDYLLEGHHRDPTPCSANSPVGRMLDLDGRILFLDVTMDCCTLIHHVEEIEAIDSYLKPSSETETYECRDRFGRSVTVDLRRHLFLPRNYWQFQDVLATRDALQVDMLGRGTVRCFEPRAMRDAVAEALARDPDAIIAKPGERYRMM
jgi:aminoglycoside 3-N-acetyltransferase